MWSITFFACLVCSSSFETIYFFSWNSIICLLWRTIISVWYFCKRKISLFNFISAAAAFFCLIKLCVILYLDFFSSLILVVAFWRIWCNSSNNFWITPLYFTMTYFYFSDVPTAAKSLHSLQHFILLSVWQIFGQTLKKEFFIGVGKLGLINYLVICLFLFRNYLNVSTLNCLLI